MRARAPEPAGRWARGEAIPVWIERAGVGADAVEMARRALRTWSAASQGAFWFEETEEFPALGIRIRFTAGDVHFGEAAPSVDRRTGRIVRADVVLSVDSPGDDLEKRLVVYLTALHEIGHALGLAHSEEFSRIMYRFRSPADPPRYFARYRQRLRSAADIGSANASGLAAGDLEALRALYR